MQMTRGTWKLIPSRLAQALIIESDDLSASLLKDISLGKDFCYILCNKCILLKYWRLFNKLICYTARPNFPDGSIPVQACNLNLSWNWPPHAPVEKENWFHSSFKTWSVWTLPCTFACLNAAGARQASAHQSFLICSLLCKFYQPSRASPIWVWNGHIRSRLNINECASKKSVPKLVYSTLLGNFQQIPLHFVHQGDANSLYWSNPFPGPTDLIWIYD